MHLRNYEKPDGWSNGQPEVFVAPNVVERLGVPLVDYDGLEQLLTDDLEIPTDRHTNIKLYGRDPESPLLGFHIPYTTSIHVNARAAEYRYMKSGGGTMRILAHEAKHRADSTNHKALTALEIAARAASYKLGYEVVHAIPHLASIDLLGGIAARKVWYKHEPAEKRARTEEKRLAGSDHEQDILFPRSERTMLLIYGGEVTLQKIQDLGRLGLKTLDLEDFASDFINDEEDS